MRRKLTRLAITAVVAAVVLQTVGAGFAASQVERDGPVSPADEIYVESDGDAVLVYDSGPHSSDANRTEFGVNVDENLAYMLLTDDVEGTPSVNGALEVTANRTAIWANGNLSTPKPPSLESFTLDVSGVTNAEQSSSDLSVAATLADQAGATAALESATTDGTVTITANRLRASGNLNVDTTIPLPNTAHESADFELRETSSGYVLEFAQSRTVDAEWGYAPENRTEAKRALDTQYQLLASQFGGSASVELESYERSSADGQIRVEQAYTVQLEGVDDGIDRLVRAALERNPDVSSEQADKLASGLKDVQINRLALDYRVDQDGVTGNFSVDVENYEALAMAYFDVLGSMDGGSAYAADVERMEKRFEAQRASGLEQQFTWSGSLTHPDSSTVKVDFEAHTRNTNWKSYVDELQSRDVPLLAASYNISGMTTGDRITVSGDAAISGDQLYAELLRGVPSTEEAPSDEAAALMTAFRESRPRKAKMVATYGAEGIRLEAGAAFGDLSALRDSLAEQTGLPPVSSVVGRMDQQGGQTVVHVSNAVDGDVSESSVRSLAYVSDETTVHMPGEGERNFASMDVERAKSFLDLNEASGSSGPGFGPIAALVAVVAAGLFLARRD